ncbi:MAG: RecX family transcriptional regulator [Clostridia bacterium]|nr:RecX family transcriptional regulator [Clostridia bacterium]
MYSDEEIDALKTKILKYVLYKKRTENEIRQKFNSYDQDILDDSIEYLKEAGYISDSDYIDRSIKEFMALKNLSVKELVYKLQTKGIDKYLIEDYVSEHKEDLVQYEITSAKNIIIKKQGSMEKEEIEDYLYKKGYISETIKLAFDEE